ncbi:hypothetical protein BDN67DRAFT_363442 [Paxillus ammoniavirescens]|nr:hypothetical protein BDN67DRAFT_363442 [Paxillus ammoniavirescens]
MEQCLFIRYNCWVLKLRRCRKRSENGILESAQRGVETWMGRGHPLTVPLHHDHPRSHDVRIPLTQKATRACMSVPLRGKKNVIQSDADRLGTHVVSITSSASQLGDATSWSYRSYSHPFSP